MIKKYESKSNLFLIELIIVILFFSIASSVCVQLFVKSHILSQNTENTNQAILWTQNISEVFYSQNGNFHSLKNFFHENSLSLDNNMYSNLLKEYDDSLILYFDSDWLPANTLENTEYILFALYRQDSSFHTLDICICQNQEILSQNLNLTDLLLYLSEHDIWNYNIQILKYKQLGGTNA